MRLTKRLAALAALFLLSTGVAWANHDVTGMVLKIDVPHKTMTVSCLSIPGYMDAMVMPFKVRDAQKLTELSAGTTVEFTWTEAADANYADNVQIKHYQSMQQDPFTARRLKLLDHIAHLQTSGIKPVGVGERVPDFRLIDQNRRGISLSQFAGKVVVMNFIYTSCALPNFCFRSTNNFGVLQQRFKQQLGRNLVLLTVTFDPQRDGPDTLLKYSKTWKADPETWHFLTGSDTDIERVTGLFGMDYFPEEGFMNHSLHTVIIDPQRKLVTNIEGNQFTADQLSDLVREILDHASRADKRNEIRSASMKQSSRDHER